MATEILMPALSPTMEEGTLAKWLVKEGDAVQSGDLLAEIETDKATMEFEAVDEGVIGKILVAEGTEAVKVNSPIAILVEEGEEVGDVATSAPAAPAAAEAEAAPAAVEASAPAAAAAPAAPAPQAADGKRIFASPLARRIAADKGLDLTQISGTGPKGRIVKADVEGATASAPAAAPAASAPAAPAAAPAPSVSSDAVAAMYQGREFEEVKLDGMRKTIAARLSEAKQTIPHFYLRRDIKLDALLAFRSQLNKQLEARGVKLSVNDFIIKAVANALQQVPEANAVWAGDRVLQMNASDVAVAVAIEGGLFTPVLQDADQKSLSSLSTQMKDLAARARDRKLAPHEYQGGSFAISNLGMFGIDNFDAIVNPPHAGILAVGTGVKKPVVGDDGELTVATIMSVTMSVDHRVIDGAVGANLLKAIVENLENPLTMLA
ncbi:Dihydrolipoyllysine-residue acetyltransferase component of pyruvate dehydrogenase complex [Aliiroseovarius sp. xm-m-379]|uniref:pyruvate dehydrogenase complex dihydrolipoamide acetyltransferase n=1 Tax=unclassified Aliiroseovarius TaxID=2623558 RepID=UPI001567E80E|nr:MULTISPECIES: pyruvate dehydrogenase complex dihydrolipoamide acetyltransferase [unclassified Aliiroseovarius]NRP11666.1 Dihydrolipoyllysine-residue acetyltransferase component of pyruvate dehydrogenase complex [Aliiroseovarius sp. xm-d-517]NRP25721.1 Dihydrolipoyllysine-residue acetyltransferase component of pyruvate dehydrogenase complex [Aliiroseovarius sp. xm-m-379]NRP31227.1 Dihydrolipoyllysine-residue acetyltransferase component of pyruvate dehydrogenase complex [Aliiroseovarius sp. xm-